MNGVLTCRLSEIVRTRDGADDREFFRGNYYEILDWFTKRVTIKERGDLVGSILAVATHKLTALMTVRPDMITLLSELTAQLPSVLLINDYPFELKKPMRKLFSAACYRASGITMLDEKEVEPAGILAQKNDTSSDSHSTLFVLSSLPKALDLVRKNRNTIIFSDSFHLRRELVLQNVLSGPVPSR